MDLLLLWKKSVPVTAPLLLRGGGGLLPRIIQSRDYSSSADDAKALFEEWAIKFDRVYNTLEEKERRFRLFRRTLKNVKNHNIAGISSSIQGLNKSSDWSAAEMRARRNPRQRIPFKYSKSLNEEKPQGCDFEHWLVLVEKPQGTRDEIIHSYIKILEKVVGSYDEARMKIYSVSTRCYYAFGALVSKEDSYKLRDCQGVVAVLPDCYMDVKNKDYGGEPFIDGKAVPYDPKYHKEWMRNQIRCRNYGTSHRSVSQSI